MSDTGRTFEDPAEAIDYALSSPDTVMGHSWEEVRRAWVSVKAELGEARRLDDRRREAAEAYRDAAGIMVHIPGKIHYSRAELRAALVIEDHEAVSVLEETDLLPEAARRDLPTRHRALAVREAVRRIAERLDIDLYV